MDGSTIAAVATPEGAGGIGIIRVSGPEATALASSVFSYSPFGDKRPEPGSGPEGGFKSWRMYLGHIFDPGTGQMIDEVIFAVMRAPFSYTREDVVEIQAHGGPVVLERILNLLISQGARAAQPGEFTRRAFLNGRMDLTQAEAVADLINARSDAALDMAASQITGRLSDAVATIRQSLLSVLGALEAAIDFPEAAGDEIDFSGQSRFLAENVIAPVHELRQAYEAGRHLRQGIQAVITGRPNVGKSSLMNCLLKQQRAIVTDIAGTTRDCIQASFTARGTPVVVADTAGLRQDPDPIERLGIEKTNQYIDTADIVLYVLDCSRAVDSEDLRIYQQLSGKPLLLVINKSDLPDSQKTLELPQEMQDTVCLEVSALFGTGVNALKHRISDMAASSQVVDKPGFVPNWRQKCLLDQTADAASRAASGLENQALPELISIDLREAVAAIDEITGRHIDADVLEEIFSRYCVGK